MLPVIAATAGALLAFLFVHSKERYYQYTAELWEARSTSVEKELKLANGKLAMMEITGIREIPNASALMIRAETAEAELAKMVAQREEDRRDARECDCPSEACAKVRAMYHIARSNLRELQDLLVYYRGLEPRK